VFWLDVIAIVGLVFVQFVQVTMW